MERKKVFDAQQSRGNVTLRAVDGGEERKLSRRRHQEGQLIKLENGWAVRFYTDVLKDGERHRERRQMFLGDFAKLQTITAARNAKDAEMASHGVNHFSVQPRTTLTFRQQAWKWIGEAERRKQKVVKPSVIYGWKSILNNHLLPIVGEVPLCDVRNRTMRSLVEIIARKGLAPLTIRNVAAVAKQVVASATDEDGNQMFPVIWNRRFIDAPMIDANQQRRPTFTAEQVTALVNETSGRPQMAVVLFAASGIRTGELLGLEVKHFDGQAVKIEQQVWHGRLLPPKTSNARRTVDLHPDAAALLKQFIGTRRSGFIFRTNGGKPMAQRNLARELYKALDRLKIPRRGFHAFRRFRNTHLRNSLCPDGLLKFWLGHAAADMSDRYDRVRDDLQFRRDVAKSLGVGFVLPPALTSKRTRRAARAKAPAVPLLGMSGVIGRSEEAAVAAK